MNNEAKLIEIAPIHEMVAGHTVKVQVRLDEDASDQEILASLDDSCREWAAAKKLEMSLRLLVGRILIAVSEREIYKQEQWGTFEAFLVYIERRYGITRTSARDAMTMVEALPEVSARRARAIGPSNLLVVARAVKLAPEAKREQLAEKLLAEADKRPPVDEFKARLEGAKLLRTSRMRRRIARIVLEVPIPVAEAWRELVGQRNGAEVFAELVRGARRKPAKAASVA